MISAVFLANSCVLLHTGEASLLVDGPCSLASPFDGVSEDEFSKMLQGDGIYDNLAGMVFTHKHSDHFDRRRVKILQDFRPSLSIFVPNGATAPNGFLQIGAFAVSYYKIPHSGLEFTDTIHRSLLVQHGENYFYFSGDSAWDNPLHEKILQSHTVCAAFWNPNFVTHEEGRKLFSMAEQNFICHMPYKAEDKFGIGKKCRHWFEKYGQNFENLQLIESYPTNILLKK